MSIRTIQTSEQLRDHIHSIHDYIRNSGQGYGMSALKIFNIFYSLKNISGKSTLFSLNPSIFEWIEIGKKLDGSTNEPIIKVMDQLKSIKTSNLYGDIVDISDNCVELQNELKKYPESEQKTLVNNYLNKIFNNIDIMFEQKNRPLVQTNMAFYIYHEIPLHNLDPVFLKKMFELINCIPSQMEQMDNIDSKISNKFDIKGKVYEYFIGRDESAISDLGAYFTDRYITNFIFDFVNPVLDDKNNVQSMVDPFGGSGGFTIQYAKYINDKYKINWTTNDNYKNIHHYDMSEDVIKVAGTEYFTITGHFPEYKSQFNKMNTFKHDFDDNKKFKYVISNPPYGGDKTSKSVDYEKNLKIMEYNKQIILKIDELMFQYIDQKEYNKIIRTIIKKNEYDNDFIRYFKMKINILEFAEVLMDYSIECESKDDLIKLIWQLYKQISLLVKKNKDEMEEQGNKQVNLKTCSNYIRNYALEIINTSNRISHKFIKKAIKKERKINDSEKLNKSYEWYKTSEPEQYTSVNDIKDSYFKDKEACSLILLMRLLAIDGVGVGLLKEGVFFNSKYSILRGYLINNFNVTDVISVPSDAFENTSTKTTIVIFKNESEGNITSNINFWELDVKTFQDIDIKYDQKVGTVIKNLKGGVESVGKKLLCTASYKQLCNVKITYNKKDEPGYEMDYSLNYKDYMDYEVDCLEGYQLDTLKNYLTFKPKSKRSASFAKPDGKYTFYTSSDKIKKCDVQDYNDDQLKIIFGTGGRGSLFMDKMFSCSADNIICVTENQYYTMYIYYYIKYNWTDYVDKMFTGSTLGHVNKENLLNYKLSIPNDINLIKPQLDELYELHQRIGQIGNEIPELEKNICKIIGKLTIGDNYDEYKLGDVIIMKSGQFNTKDMTNTGEYPFYNASVNNPIGTINQYCFDENKYILFIKSGGNSKNKISDSHALGLPLLVSGQTSANVHVSQILIKKNINITYEYLYYYLLLIKPIIQENAKYSTGLGGVNMDHFREYKIKVLKPHIMVQHNINQMFQQMDDLKIELVGKNELYKTKLDELFGLAKGQLIEPMDELSLVESEAIEQPKEKKKKNKKNKQLIELE
jgi:type I restriction-modification system DNA methylase subunit